MRLLFLSLFLIGIIVQSNGQPLANEDSETKVQSLIQAGAMLNPPGLRMMKTGRALTIGGGVLLVGGIVLMSTADAIYYTASSGSYGSTEEGDPKGALGLVMAVGGVGMIVLGIIFWSKGAKKFNAYNQKQSASVGIGRYGIGLQYRF